FGVLVSESDDVNTKNEAGKLGFIPNVPPVTELYAWAKNKTEGTVSDALVVSPQGYNIVKRGAEREGEAQVKASHLLVCYLGAKDCAATMTKEEARTKITELAKKATTKNFAQLVKENSTDASNKDTGGDLGYFTKAQMVPSFAEAAFAAKDGAIVGPVETDFGFHLIYRQAARQEKEYEVSRILVATKTASDILGTGNWKSTGLSGKQLERAEVVTDQKTGAAQVSLKFNSEGAELFRQITQRNLQKPIAIFLDNTPEPLTTPNVNTVIPDGQAVITGNFTLPEAQKLAQRLNAGALPVPVELVSQQVIGATLGAEALSKSLQAGLASLVIIMVFMVAVYRLPGFISAISLCLYTLITLGVFKFMDVTITLAGIAGFIMSLGVAIDANVLIFERLKEELGLGKNLRTAMEEGFVRAWTSIRDGNAATIITGVILIWFGSSFVQGFAITLIIGTLVSLFTAITVTRTLMRFILPWFKNNGGWLFLGATPKKN
ncbi:MAG: protein translocase subunit SecD, partial [Candidatus Magasanikbacteria bacterium]|nr:protein translocase subunit SecD [Candidatus Magasanikbacteria bacterium]